MHAVMQLNAEDGGRRRFVMVQIAAECPEGSAAAKAGFKTIDEIGRRRIELAAEKIRKENPEKARGMDLGFKHFTLAEPKEETLDKVASFDAAQNLTGDADGLLGEFGEKAVLATWMVRDGYGLTEEAEPVDLAGYTAYWRGNHIYFLRGGLTAAGLTALVDRYETDGAFGPTCAVVFGYGAPFTMREGLRANLAKLADGDKNLRVALEVRY